MNSSATSSVYHDLTNYPIVAPLSMTFAIIAIGLSLCILILAFFSKPLHTVTHLLMSNTCIASIVYCAVQCNNYIYLLFIKWDQNDQSCRWRGYFAYMSIVAVVYSYLLQAISRFFIIILSMRFRWLTTIRTHLYLIVIGWLIVFIIPLPALVTTDIYFRQGFLCWVPKRSILHGAYTVLAYYLIPVLLIVAIYVFIYMRIRNHVGLQHVRRRQKRDLEVFRNIMILLSIYTIGAIPVILFMLTGVEFLFSVGMVSVTLTVTMEKLVSLFLDREIRTVLKKCFCPGGLRIKPLAINHVNVS